MLKNKDIHDVNSSEYEELIKLWEESVRAIHHFLKEEDLIFYKKLIKGYFDNLILSCIKDEKGKILGFSAVNGNDNMNANLEMLFISPSARGKGVGRKLLNYVIKEN